MRRLIILAVLLVAVVLPLSANAYTIWYGPHGFVIQYPQDRFAMERSTGGAPPALRLWAAYGPLYNVGIWLPLALPSYAAIDSVKVCYSSGNAHITRTELVRLGVPQQGWQQVFTDNTQHSGSGCYSVYTEHFPARDGVVTLRLDLTFDQQGSFDNPGIDIGAIGISVSTIEPVAIDEAPAPPPTSSAVGVNAPNPFSAATEIRYTLAAASSAEVRIYDAGGRLVRSVFAGRQEPGEYRVSWDGRDAAGQSTPSGTYFYDIIVDGKRLGAGKALIIR